MAEGIVKQDCAWVGQGIFEGTKTLQDLFGLKYKGEELLPGIPDTLTLAEIIPKLSFKDCNVLSQVNSLWQKSSKARVVYDARVSYGSAEIFAAVHQVSGSIVLYSMKEKIWYKLPPLPFYGRISNGYECLSLDGRLYVIGGSMNGADKQEDELHGGLGSNEVYMLDLAGHSRWKRCASMHKPRFDFGAAIDDGTIYVFGGRSGSELIPGWEVYDPKVNSWSQVRSGASVQIGHQVAAAGRELFVYGGYPQGGRQTFVEAFDTVRNNWRPIQGSNNRFWDGAFVVQGKFHKLTECGGIFVYDMDKSSWSLVHICAGFPGGVAVCPSLLGGRVMLLGDELLLVSCKPREASPRPCLLQSRGFGKATKIVWEIETGGLDFEDKKKTWTFPIVI